jgi:hypothetical protein
MSVDRYQTSSTYVHPQDSNLLNLHKAMQYNDNDQPVVRVALGGEDITITGDVTIPAEVLVYTTATSPLFTHLVKMGSVTLTDFMPIKGSITGTVEVSNLPAVQTITGTVVASNFTSSVRIISMPNINGVVTVNSMPPITGTVAISNFPTTSTVYQGTDPWVVTGTVRLENLPEVEIKNDTGNPIPISKNTSANSDSNPIFVKGSSDTSFFAPTQSDAFGRLRVSNPLTLFDTQNRYFDHEQFSSNVAGGGTVVYNSNSSAFALSVTGNGSSVRRETTKTFVYQPGKSLLVLNTFAMNAPMPGLTQRVGYFGTQNGIFFEANATTLNMVIRSYSSGSIVENRIAQSSWNGDKLNGTGPSGITLNPALTQIFWTDVEWLGVGSVRVGFVINGQFIVCHTFNHSNIPGNITTYMTTACLPCRYEISSTGPAGTMTQICSTVISEGGYSLTGLPRSAAHNLASPRRLANGADTYTPLISIRLKSTNLDAIVLPINFTIAAVASSNYKYRIYKKAITTGGTWNSAGNNSSVEYNLNPTSVISGDVNEEAFIISSNQSSQAPSQVAFAFEEQLQRDSFTGTAFEYVITATTTGNNQDLYASIEWQEVS